MESAAVFAGAFGDFFAVGLFPGAVEGFGEVGLLWAFEADVDIAPAGGGGFGFSFLLFERFRRCR